MKKNIIFFTLIYLIFIPAHFSIGATTTGFIPGQIWYSKTPLVEGDTVKIYTALFNSGSTSLSAKIEFYDKNVILGSRDIVVPSLKVQDTSISWKVTSGDHSISAKIISPNFTVGSSTTETDRTFVPVVLTTAEGKTATQSDILKSQLDKATSSISDIVPEAISAPVSSNVGVIDSFRANTFDKISETKVETQKKIDELNNPTSVSKVPTSKTTASNSSLKDNKNKTSTVDNKSGIVDATEKPIAYLKLFFFTILSFIFGTKLVFYLLIILILFFITRGIYRKIRNR